MVTFKNGIRSNHVGGRAPAGEGLTELGMRNRRKYVGPVFELIRVSEMACATDIVTAAIHSLNLKYFIVVKSAILMRVKQQQELEDRKTDETVTKDENGVHGAMGPSSE